LATGARTRLHPAVDGLSAMRDFGAALIGPFIVLAMGFGGRWDPTPLGQSLLRGVAMAAGAALVLSISYTLRLLVVGYPSPTAAEQPIES
jgi:hypothetical protein